MIAEETKARDDRPLYAALAFSVLVHALVAFVVTGRIREAERPRPLATVTFLPLEDHRVLAVPEEPQRVAAMSDERPSPEAPALSRPDPPDAAEPVLAAVASAPREEEPAGAAAVSPKPAPVEPSIAAPPSEPVVAPAFRPPPVSPLYRADPAPLVVAAVSPAPVARSMSALPAMGARSAVPVEPPSSAPVTAPPSRLDDVFAQYRDRFGRLLQGRAERIFRRENREGTEGVVTLRISVRSGRARVEEIASTLPMLEEIMRSVVGEAAAPVLPDGLSEPLLLAYRFRFRLEGR